MVSNRNFTDFDWCQSILFLTPALTNKQSTFCSYGFHFLLPMKSSGNCYFFSGLFYITVQTIVYPCCYQWWNSSWRLNSISLSKYKYWILYSILFILCLIFIIYICIYLYLYVTWRDICVLHDAWCPERTEKGVKYPGTGEIYSVRPYVGAGNWTMSSWKRAGALNSSTISPDSLCNILNEGIT